MSKYILTIINATLSTLISTATVYWSDSWFISIASISYFYQYSCPFPSWPRREYRIWSMYTHDFAANGVGSCIHSMSVPSSPIIFCKLYFAALECLRYICRQSIFIFILPILFLHLSGSLVNRSI